MSTNLSGLSRIDSQAIGQSEADPNPEVTEPEAIIASGEAGLDAQIVIATRARMAVGRFAAAGMSGYIVGDTLRDQDIIEKALDKLSGMLVTEQVPDNVVKIADALSKLANSRTANRAVLLKAVEISAERGKRKTRRSNAPQGVIEGNTFNGPVQVNTAAPLKPAE